MKEPTMTEFERAAAAIVAKYADLSDLTNVPVAAAMQVVERMRELGYLVTISDLSPHRSGRGNRRGQWFVRFTKKGEEGKQAGVATGDNVCEAVCLAALRAVGGEGGRK